MKLFKLFGIVVAILVAISMSLFFVGPLSLAALAAVGWFGYKFLIARR